MPKFQSREEFEVAYLANSPNVPGDGLALLRAFRRFAIPCDCEDEICLGWQMAHDVDRDVQNYILALEVEKADLLAALEDCIRELDYAREHGWGKGIGTGAVTIARAAITRARGAAPGQDPGPALDSGEGILSE